MPGSFIGVAPALSAKADSPSFAFSPSALRALLFAGCVGVVAVAAMAGDSAARLRSDPELMLLLRGMAAIKAGLVLAAVGALWWRFGHPVSHRNTTAYLCGAWLCAGATVLVWQLSFIPLAALVFHVGEFMLLFTAWRDRECRTIRSVASEPPARPTR